MSLQEAGTSSLEYVVDLRKTQYKRLQSEAANVVHKSHWPKCVVFHHVEQQHPLPRFNVHMNHRTILQFQVLDSPFLFHR